MASGNLSLILSPFGINDQRGETLKEVDRITGHGTNIIVMPSFPEIFVHHHPNKVLLDKLERAKIEIERLEDFRSVLIFLHPSCLGNIDHFAVFFRGKVRWSVCDHFYMETPRGRSIQVVLDKLASVGDKNPTLIRRESCTNPVLNYKLLKEANLIIKMEESLEVTQSA